MRAVAKSLTSYEGIFVNGLISVDVRVRKLSLRRVRRTLVPPTSPMTATTSSWRGAAASVEEAFEFAENIPIKAIVAIAAVAPARAEAMPTLS